MSFPQVVGIVGYLRSGKDTVAQVLVNKFGFTRVGFADAIKEEVARTLPRTLDTISRSLGNGVAGPFLEKSPIIRTLLQEWGTELRRAEQPDYWIRKWQHKVLDLTRVVAPDCRFENEARAIRKRGGILWRVVRPGLPVAYSRHLSETEQDYIHVDLTIDNIGTVEDLRQQAYEAVIKAEMT